VAVVRAGFVGARILQQPWLAQITHDSNNRFAAALVRRANAARASH
jgi:hypothetical protein